MFFKDLQVIYIGQYKHLFILIFRQLGGSFWTFVPDLAYPE